jgi:shikimate kinase
MNNIVLIGMPGAGKSTTGIILAKAIGYEFVDTDILIQNQEKKLLQEIINQDGIDKFLEIEEKIILTNNFNNCVIATGGSVVLSEKAMRHLGALGKIIYLELSLETITKRIANIKTRGIAMGNNQTLQDVYNARTPYYKKYADFILDCENKTLEDIINSIIKLNLKNKKYEH